jgi:hypothetical protein
MSYYFPKNSETTYFPSSDIVPPIPNDTLQDHYLTLAESDAAAAHHRASPADRWNLK